MWARVVEIMLGCWLVISPFVFRHGPDESLLWANDLACGSLVAAISLAAFHPRLGRIHLLNGAVAFWLVGCGFLGAPPPPPPALQNWVGVGLLLAMLAILPSRATLPPRAWLEFARRGRDE
jgi:hypothetical protein